MTWKEYYVQAAQKSRWNDKLWVRYLNKAIQREQIFLSAQDISDLTASSDLTNFQKQFLKLAVKKNSAEWQETISQSEPSNLTNLKNVMKQIQA